MRISNYLKFSVYSLAFAVVLLAGCEDFRDPLNFPGRQGNMRYATAPGIRDLYIFTLTNTSANIVWKTDKPGNSQVSYGPTAGQGTNVLDANAVVNHSITLQGLTLGTRYSYTVKSQDSLGNIAMSSQMQFITTGGATSKPDSSSIVTVIFTISGFSGNLPQEAVWIEDSNGNFIKTLFASNWGSGNSEGMPTWAAKSNNNTNGRTGATKFAGPVSWDCTDTNSTPVPAGTYKYFIEVNQRDNISSLLTQSGTLVLGNSSSNSTGSSGGFIAVLSGSYTP